MSAFEDFGLAGKVAVVTGGANGLGRAVSETLIAAKADVDIWDLDVPAFEGAGYAAVDVTDAELVANATRSLIDRFGRIDILINNAGLAGMQASLDDYDPAEWRRIVEVNLTGVFEACRHVVPHMRRRGEGRIVNVAARAGRDGTPNASAYSAAKAGVIALTQSLAKELGDTSITANCIAPGAREVEHDVVRTILWLGSQACTISMGTVVEITGGPSAAR